MNTPSLRTVLLSVAAIAALLLVPAAFAGKGGKPGGPGGGGGGGGGGGSSSLSLVVLSEDGVNNYGDQVTFNVSTTATDQPMVRVDCYQSGAHVYWASAGFYPGYPWQWAQNFTLKSTYWTGGAADCTATLYHYDGRRYRDLASMGFSVSA